VAIRPHENVLTMETLLFSDEVIAPDDLPELDAAAEMEVREKELGMAKQLIESLATDFDPTRYRDEYRETVLEMIERKAEGQEVAVQAAPEEPAEVPDLMAALEASIASAKRQGGKKAAAESDGNGAKPSRSRSKGGSSSSKGKGSGSKRTSPKRSTAKK
jgi:DNA end-binding protein Ku